MRFYDAKNQEVFQPGSKLWNEFMLTKKGNPRKNISWGIFKYITEVLGYRLYPSVTEIASALNGFGAFGIGAKWATNVTAEQAGALLAKNTGANPEAFVKAVQKASLAVQTEARDKGTLLHGIFHDVVTGKLKESDLTDEGKKMLHACRCALHNDIDCPPGSYKTEVFVTITGSCGTADLWSEINKTIVDWKTVKDFRPVHHSELGQLAAYMAGTSSENGYIVQIKQSTFEYKIHGPIKPLERSSYYQMFDLARRMLSTQLGVKLSKTKIIYPEGQPFGFHEDTTDAVY